MKKNKLKFTPFTVLIDDRETLPYSFTDVDKKGHIVTTARKRLETGDYSIQCIEDRIVIERKTLQDLYSTLGHGRARFEKEFERFSDLDFAAIIIEASLDEINDPTSYFPDWRSRLDPRSVIGTVVTWSVRYPKAHWVFAGNREYGEKITYELLRKFWEEKS